MRFDEILIKISSKSHQSLIKSHQISSNLIKISSEVRFPGFSKIFQIFLKKSTSRKSHQNLIRGRFCINHGLMLKQYVSRNLSKTSHQISSKSHHCDFCGFLRFLWISWNFVGILWISKDFNLRVPPPKFIKTHNRFHSIRSAKS